MKKCDGCNKRFDQHIAMYPRLVYGEEVQVAQALQGEDRREDMLCTRCWIEAAQAADHDDLVHAALGLLTMMQDLERRIPVSTNSEILNQWVAKGGDIDSGMTLTQKGIGSRKP